jgi:hypothetical protein
VTKDPWAAQTWAEIHGKGPDLSAHDRKIRQYEELLQRLNQMPCKEVRKLGRKLKVREKPRPKRKQGVKERPRPKQTPAPGGYADAIQQLGGLAQALDEASSDLYAAGSDAGSDDAGLVPQSSKAQEPGGREDHLQGVKTKDQSQQAAQSDVTGTAGKYSTLYGALAGQEKKVLVDQAASYWAKQSQARKKGLTGLAQKYAQKAMQTGQSIKLVNAVGRVTGVLGPASAAAGQWLKSEARTPAGRAVSAVAMAGAAVVAGSSLVPALALLAADTVAPGGYKPSSVLAKAIDQEVVIAEQVVQSVWNGNWDLFALERKKPDIRALDIKPLPPQWTLRPSGYGSLR